MLQQRTQIYLDRAQHAALIREARRLGLSLAGMIRRLVDEHFAAAGDPASSAGDRRKSALSLIGLGSSGLADVSERTDRYLAAAIREERLGERRAGYRGRRKPR